MEGQIGIEPTQFGIKFVFSGKYNIYFYLMMYLHYCNTRIRCNYNVKRRILQIV